MNLINTHILPCLKGFGFAPAPDVPDEVRLHVPSAVRHDGGQIGHVHRGGQQLAFSDADGVDGSEGPMAPTVNVVVV